MLLLLLLPRLYFSPSKIMFPGTFFGVWWVGGYTHWSISRVILFAHYHHGTQVAAILTERWLILLYIVAMDIFFVLRTLILEDIRDVTAFRPSWHLLYCSLCGKGSNLLIGWVLSEWNNDCMWGFKFPNCSVQQPYRMVAQASDWRS